MARGLMRDDDWQAIRKEKEEQAAERYMLWCAVDAYRDILQRDQVCFPLDDSELTPGQASERRKLRALERLSERANAAYEEGLK